MRPRPFNLEMTDAEACRSLRTDRVYGPEIQRLQKAGKLDEAAQKRINQRARIEYCRLKATALV